MSVEYVGPFSTKVVVLDGRKVPFLEAELVPGGIVSLLLDQRYGLDLTVEQAEATVPFIADAIAIGLGYAGHPRDGADPVVRPAFTRLIELAKLSADSTQEAK